MPTESASSDSAPPGSPSSGDAPSDAAAQVLGVRHRYGGAPPVLCGISLTLERGTITALVGSNGAGKTTLLRVLAGILEPTSGEVRVLGLDPRSLRRRAVRDLRRRVGYLSQRPAVDPEMTGREVLELCASLYGVGRRERRVRVPELAESFGLTAHLGRRVEDYSGGLRRRLHLAAGMIHQPELLCLDEPAAGLDRDGKSFLWSELGRRAADGAGVVVVSHDLAAVERHAGAVHRLENGIVVEG